jgi:hypothetical protein
MVETTPGKPSYSSGVTEIMSFSYYYGSALWDWLSPDSLAEFDSSLLGDKERLVCQWKKQEQRLVKGQWGRNEQHFLQQGQLLERLRVERELGLDKRTGDECQCGPWCSVGTLPW